MTVVLQNLKQTYSNAVITITLYFKDFKLNLNYTIIIDY